MFFGKAVRLTAIEWSFFEELGQLASQVVLERVVGFEIAEPIYYGSEF